VDIELVGLMKIVEIYPLKFIVRSVQKMNKPEQIQKLKELSQLYKVDFDLIDFEALVDKSLTYEENLSILKEKIFKKRTERKSKQIISNIIIGKNGKKRKRTNKKMVQ
jgi:hypothetical protein